MTPILPFFAKNILGLQMNTIRNWLLLTLRLVQHNLNTCCMTCKVGCFFFLSVFYLSGQISKLVNFIQEIVSFF